MSRLCLLSQRHRNSPAISKWMTPSKTPTPMPIVVSLLGLEEVEEVGRFDVEVVDEIDVCELVEMVREVVES